MPRNARAQLCVIQVNPSSSNAFVSEYDASTGTLINSSFITGLTSSLTLALAGKDIYVTNVLNPVTGIGVVGKYNARTGGAINSGFISLTAPEGLAVAGKTLYVTDLLDNKVGTYNPTTGGVINASFVTTGLNNPVALALSGTTLFVSNAAITTGRGAGTVGAYNANTGAVINASFISGLTSPVSLALVNNTLYVSNSGSPASGGNPAVPGTVGTYDATTGAVINASLITGVSGDEITGIFVKSAKK
jgi:hypothetical protein